MLCFITNNKEKALEAIQAFQPIKHENPVLVVAPEKIAGELPADYKTSEEAFKDAHPETIFEGAYGGNRNIALAACNASKENAIFFDDDTSPVHDPIKKHLKLLENHEAVFGKYVGHARGTLSCLLKLVQEYNKPEPSQETINNCLSNIPNRVATPVKGIVGGNTSIRLDAIPKQCFYPTHYRVEDALYYGLSQHYGFTCLEPSDPPIVQHEKTGSPGDLAKALENEVIGGAIARCISKTIEQKLDVKPETITPTKKQCFQESWEYYSLDYAKKKLPENEDTKQIHGIQPENLLPTDEKFFGEVNKFFDAQKQWRPTLKKVRAEEFKC